MSASARAVIAGAEAKGATLSGVGAAAIELRLTIATAANFAVLAVSLYGGYINGDMRIGLTGSTFFVGFLLTRRRAASRQPSQVVQIMLVLALIVASFCLHLFHLPAGLCCFTALMMTRNEVLLPSSGSASSSRAGNVNPKDA